MPENEGNFFKDMGLGILAFLAMGLFAFLVAMSTASMSRGGNLSSLPLFVGFACFLGLLVASIRYKRPGLILGFVSAIGLLIGGLMILLVSFCGGGWH